MLVSGRVHLCSSAKLLDLKAWKCFKASERVHHQNHKAKKKHPGKYERLAHLKITYRIEIRKIIWTNKPQFWGLQNVNVPQGKKWLSPAPGFLSQPLHLSKRECHILRSIHRVVEPSLEKNLHKSNWIHVPRKMRSKIKKSVETIT